MGEAAGGASSALSIGSLGFTAAGDYMKAQGTASADTFKAEQLERAAQYGELKAVQTSGQLTRNLSMTLGNIDAVRASARTDPTSPTGAAVRGMVENIGTEQNSTQVKNIMRQATEDRAGAAYLRSASSKALLAGDLSIGGDILKALGPLALGLNFSGAKMGNSSVGNPTKLGALY